MHILGEPERRYGKREADDVRKIRRAIGGRFNRGKREERERRTKFKRADILCGPRAKGPAGKPGVTVKLQGKAQEKKTL